MTRPASSIARLLALLALTGTVAVPLGACGDPYEDNKIGATQPDNYEGVDGDLDRPDSTTGVVTDPAAAGDAKGAEKVAREFAATSLTYSPDTYIAQQKFLRERATGQMAEQLEPAVPDADVEQSLKAEALTSRATVLVSDVEAASSGRADIIVLLKVFTGSRGRLSTTPDYQQYRVRLTKTDGSWKVRAMDAP